MSWWAVVGWRVGGQGLRLCERREGAVRVLSMFEGEEEARSVVLKADVMFKVISRGVTLP